MDSVSEIKYRVWNEELEEMYTISKEKYLGSTGIVDPYVGHEKAVWMQFTGLTDKNGREIYEGDILGRYGYVVSFVDGADSAALGMPMGWYEQRDDFESYRQLEVGDIKEVIGNIHQHRYLLKEKN